MRSQRVAIVTGAGRGIGAAIAVRLQADGHIVLGMDLVWAEHRPETSFDLDITDWHAVQDSVARVERQFGRVDIVVNNAGITRDGIGHKMDPASQWAPVVDVNLTGAFHVCRAVLPSMRERCFGRIISLSSMNGLRGAAGQANYAAAKAGLIGMSKALALENAARGITVNCIAPGFIETDMTRAMPPAARAEGLAAVPVGRVGTPEDVAHAVSFLVSDEASFITGQTLGVNGGQLMP